MTARTPQLALFDDEPARLDGRTPEQREADLAQIRAEIRHCRDGVSGLRLAEITEHWLDDVAELESELSLHRENWQELRDTILHEPDHDSDTINWALSHIDYHIPETAPQQKASDRNG